MVENNKPIKTYKGKTLSLSLWENEGEYDTTLKSFSFQKSYKDTNGEWQHTQVLMINDLPVLQLLLEEAYKDCVIKEL